MTELLHMGTRAKKGDMTFRPDVLWAIPNDLNRRSIFPRRGPRAALSVHRPRGEHNLYHIEVVTGIKDITLPAKEKSSQGMIGDAPFVSSSLECGGRQLAGAAAVTASWRGTLGLRFLKLDPTTSLSLSPSSVVARRTSQPSRAPPSHCRGRSLA